MGREWCVVRRIQGGGKAVPMRVKTSLGRYNYSNDFAQGAAGSNAKPKGQSEGILLRATVEHEGTHRAS